MAFHILHTASQTKVKDADGNLEVYETGALAAQRAKELTEATGEKHKPAKAPMVDDIDWMTREEQRLYGPNASYIRCERELTDLAPHKHFLHVSEDKPHLIAYTQNEEKGRADIQTRKSVSTYLKELRAVSRPRSSAAALSDEDITRIEAEHFARFSAKVHFAKTPEEIIAVYTNYDPKSDGVNDSCMRHDASEFAGHIHPVAVYGNSDLQVAYLKNSDGKTTHRALVYPKEKLYSRVYGDSSAFHAALKKLGYAKSSGYYGRNGTDGLKSMKGARIRRIKDDNGNGYIMPYIDEVSYVDHLTDEAGDWWALGVCDEGCRETYGTTEDPEYESCEHCGDRVDDEDCRQVRTDHWVFEMWCDHCANADAFYCEGREELLSDSCYSSVEVGACTYEETYAQFHFNQCEHSGAFTRGYLIKVIIDASDGEVKMWCSDAVDYEAFYCRETGKLYCQTQAKKGSLERSGRRSHGTYYTGSVAGADEHVADLLEAAE